MIWKLIGLMFGYREFRDVTDGKLIVYRNGDQHFYSWRDAVKSELRHIPPWTKD